MVQFTYKKTGTHLPEIKKSGRQAYVSACN